VIDNLSVGNGRYGFYAYGLQALAAFEHNLVFGNARADYAGLEDPTGTFGNVSADPLLDADQRPTTGSPAIDAGTDAAAWGVAVDIEGTARPLGAAWDIGAYEVE
jgi:hypothetical protein